MFLGVRLVVCLFARVSVRVRLIVSVCQALCLSVCMSARVSLCLFLLLCACVFAFLSFKRSDACVRVDDTVQGFAARTIGIFRREPCRTCVDARLNSAISESLTANDTHFPMGTGAFERAVAHAELYVFPWFHQASLCSMASS